MKKDAIMPVKHTSKKIQYKGVQRFVNLETGEIRDMMVTDIEERDFNFSKVWMRNFIASLDLVGNQKTRLCFWIIENLNKHNQIPMNYRQIAAATDMSLDTVRKTMKILQDCDFLRRVGTVYTVNPDIVFKGNRNARLAVLQDYHAEPIKKLTPAEKIANFDAQIEELIRQRDKLKADLNAVDMEIDPQLSFNADGDIVETARVVEQQRNKRRGGSHG